MDRARRFAASFFAGLFVFAGCARLSGCVSGDWSIDRIEERWNSEDPKEDLIRFKNGKTWENLGMKVEKIAEISGPSGSRVVAFKALSCVECEPDLLLTIRSSAGEKVVSVSYPGELTSLNADTGVRETAPFALVRAYYGKCLDAGDREVFVVRTKTISDGKETIKVVSPTETGVEATKIEKLATAIEGAGVTSGCHEIKGIDRDVED